jgi:phosphatidylinositol alpha-1,6-mannosyltransferase
MPGVLVVTNDFPPRAGGIQAFVHALAVRLAAVTRVVVYAPSWPGARAFDEEQPFTVVRHRTSLMLPVPAVSRTATALLREHDLDAVWFGAAAPLGLLARRLRTAGAVRLVATTHGHEAGWAVLPGAAQVLRRVARDVDVLTYLGDYTRRRLQRAVAAGAALERLTPGVDAQFFSPAADGAVVRERYDIAGRPVIVCVSRLVPRKGQDALIRAMPLVRAAVPDAALLVVGDGPYRASLEKLTDRVGVRGAVRFTGPVDWAQLPAHFAAGDVFAMPCRTRRGGLDVEGLGIVYLEASATGLPVVSGRSGGAPDAVLDGVTGEVVDGRDVAAVAQALVGLLRDPGRARRMGEAGREWVRREWTWDASASHLAAMLGVGARGGMGQE